MQQGTKAVVSRQWRIRTGIVLPVLCIALGLQTTAVAMSETRDRDDKTIQVPRQGLRESARASAGLSKDRIIDMVEKRYVGSKVLKADEGNHKGRRIYVLRLLSKEGRVKDVRVDAETGSEL